MTDETNQRPAVEGGYDSSDAIQVNNKKRSRKRKQHKNDSVLKTLLATTDGRAWMWELLTATHQFATSFTGDPLTSAFAEGERNIGVRLLGDIMRVTPASFVQMMQEQNPE